MENHVAIVTGGARGIGKQTILSLAKKGIHIAINYLHSKEEATLLATYIQQKYHIKALAIQGDVSSLEDVCTLITEAKAYFGTIDILIHNAGPFITERKKLSHYTLKEWHNMMDGNLNSFFYLLKGILPLMEEQKWGRIVVMGFNQVTHAPAWQYRGAYAAAKSGVASLVKTLALEEAENHITINMVCPGDIKNQYKEMSIQKARTEDQKSHRAETGEDIARVIAFYVRMIQII